MITTTTSRGSVRPGRLARPAALLPLLLALLALTGRPGHLRAQDAAAQPMRAAVRSAAADALAAERALPLQGRPTVVLGRAAQPGPLEGLALSLMEAQFRAAGLNVRPAPGLPAGPDVAALLNCYPRVLDARRRQLLVVPRLNAATSDGLLHVQCADGASGTVVSDATYGFRLDEALAELATAEPATMQPADALWLELLDELFRPLAPRMARPAAERAEAAFLMDAGLWQHAARAYRSLADAEPSPALMRAVFALQLAGQPRDAALDALQAVLNHYPDSGPLYALDAWLMLRRDRPDDAVVFLEQARMSDMTREGLYIYARGLVGQERGDTAAARERFARAAELLPDLHFVQLKAARAFCREAGADWQPDSIGRAIGYYRRATETDGADAETWAELGVLLEAAGHADDALEAMRTALSMQDDSPTIARNLASLLKRRGRHEEALGVLRRCAGYCPCNPAMQAAYGDLALEMWRVSDAEAAYRKAAADGTGPAWCQVRLAASLRIQRRYDEAQQILTDVLAREPEAQSARIELGRILAELGHTGEALAALQAAGRSAGSEPEASLALARVCMDAGRPAEAVRWAQIASHTPSAASYALLAEAFLANAEQPKAERAAATAVDDYPSSAAGHLAMARALTARGAYAEAEAETRRCLEIDPFSFDALYLLGSIQESLDEPRECLATWRRALDMNPWHAELHRRLADVLGAELGDQEGAMQHFRRYLELDAMRARTR